MINVITILTFSGRKNNGNCVKISKFITDDLGRENITNINFSDYNIHNCSHCNYECLKQNNTCSIHVPA